MKDQQKPTRDRHHDIPQSTFIFSDSTVETRSNIKDHLDLSTKKRNVFIRSLKLACLCDKSRLLCLVM